MEHFMGRYKSTNPLDCRIAISCDRETKDLFKNMAQARGITVSKLLMGLISDGAKLERQKRERIRQLAVQLVNA